MECSDLLKLIKKGEDSKTQFKEKIDSIDALAAEICAFANTEGGQIIIGVTDKGELAGVDNIHRLNQTISNAASGKLEPPLSVTTENILYNDKLVVIINVPRGDEMIIPTTSIDDIDMFVFRDFYEKEYGMSLDQSGLPLEKLLTNLKLLKEGNLTLAGLLIFGAKPSRIRPQYIIKAVAFPGTDISGNEYLDSEDIDGILFHQYKDAMAFLKRNLKKVQRGQNVNLPGILEIPEIALEEAVVNALVHRDYFIDSSIRIFVFDDRVEIISPGKLPN